MTIGRATEAPNHARRNFLRGRMAATPPPIRPPWSTEQGIAKNCTQCSACVDACPQQILFMGDGGLPQVDFKMGMGECTFCGNCAAACAEDVFINPRPEPPWALKPVLTESACLAHAGTHCEFCRDACASSAILFAPRIGGPPRPSIDVERCTGCGACVSICPKNAIALLPAMEAA